MEQAVADATAALEAVPGAKEWFQSAMNSRNDGFATFARSLHQQLFKKGDLTDRQWETVKNGIERQRAWQRKREQEREVLEQSDGVDLRDLPSGTYAVPNGDTRLKLRVKHVAAGKWAGWTFVDDGAEYGHRQKYGYARPEEFYHGKVEEQLRKICADPLEAAKEYGRITGTCGVCGKKLENPESVAAGIGPICAGKF